MDVPLAWQPVRHASPGSWHLPPCVYSNTLPCAVVFHDLIHVACARRHRIQQHTTGRMYNYSKVLYGAVVRSKLWWRMSQITTRQWRMQDLQTGSKVERCPKIFFWEGDQKKMILNLKLSNSRHSKRHFCSLATCCTSKNTAFGRQRGACPRPPVSATATIYCKTAEHVRYRSSNWDNECNKTINSCGCVWLLNETSNSSLWPGAGRAPDYWCHLLHRSLPDIRRDVLLISFVWFVQ